MLKMGRGAENVKKEKKKEVRHCFLESEPADRDHREYSASDIQLLCQCHRPQSLSTRLT